MTMVVVVVVVVVDNDCYACCSFEIDDDLMKLLAKTAAVGLCRCSDHFDNDSLNLTSFHSCYY